MRQIHKKPCKGCPSKNWPDDPETIDIRENYSKEVIAKEYLFGCLNDFSKLCKGLCDNMGIDEEYLNKV